jgi:ABC-type Na+ transport system ATPase subunit NatA
VEIVRLEPAVRAVDDVSLLVVLGSWLAILGRRDQGASG